MISQKKIIAYSDVLVGVGPAFRAGVNKSIQYPSSWVTFLDIVAPEYFGVRLPIVGGLFKICGVVTERLTGPCRRTNKKSVTEAQKRYLMKNDVTKGAEILGTKVAWSTFFNIVSDMVQISLAYLSTSDMKDYRLGASVFLGSTIFRYNKEQLNQNRALLKLPIEQQNEFFKKINTLLSDNGIATEDSKKLLDTDLTVESRLNTFLNILQTILKGSVSLLIAGAVFSSLVDSFVPKGDDNYLTQMSEFLVDNIYKPIGNFFDDIKVTDLDVLTQFEVSFRSLSILLDFFGIFQAKSSSKKQNPAIAKHFNDQIEKFDPDTLFDAFFKNADSLRKFTVFFESLYTSNDLDQARLKKNLKLQALTTFVKRDKLEKESIDDTIAMPLVISYFNDSTSPKAKLFIEKLSMLYILIKERGLSNIEELKQKFNRIFNPDAQGNGGHSDLREGLRQRQRQRQRPRYTESFHQEAYAPREAFGSNRGKIARVVPVDSPPQTFEELQRSLGFS